MNIYSMDNNFEHGLRHVLPVFPPHYLPCANLLVMLQFWKKRSYMRPLVVIIIQLRSICIKQAPLTFAFSNRAISRNPRLRQPTFKLLSSLPKGSKTTRGMTKKKKTFRSIPAEFKLWIPRSLEIVIQVLNGLLQSLSQAAFQVFGLKALAASLPSQKRGSCFPVHSFQFSTDFKHRLHLFAHWWVQPRDATPPPLTKRRRGPKEKQIRVDEKTWRWIVMNDTEGKQQDDEYWMLTEVGCIMLSYRMYAE